MSDNKGNFPDNTLFFCRTCAIDKIKTPATASCKECEELHCETCSNKHRKKKASSTHTITFHRELLKKSTCEPCCFIGEHVRQAVYVCLDCDEVQCSDCRSVHVKQKITRNHTVICWQTSAESDSYCQPCFKSGQQTTPIKFCKVCFQLLCHQCVNKHRQDSSTTGHKLGDISKYPQLMKLESGNVGTQSKYVTGSKDAKMPSKIETNFVREPSKPGKPGVVGKVQTDTLSLVWSQPIKLYENHNYQLRLKEVSGNGKWNFHPEQTTRNSIILHNLKSETKYVFQVRMVNNDLEGPYSDISDTVETIQSGAQRLLGSMREVEKADVNITLKKLSLREHKKTRNETAKTRKLFIGDANKTHSKERTIMLVGSTGTGKSTLVDGMINYLLGVNWNDPYRLTLVDLEDDEMNNDTDQAVSQTKWITCYTINPLLGSRLDYTLNIIDTPGFGDTGGIDRDKKIIEQIRTLFSSDDETGVLYLDAVCFLVKAPDARLTPTQMYIFNSIMSLFGQDIENNFCMLVTFADGKRPPVLSALKSADLPHEQYFPFNNSGLFADNMGENVSSFSPMFWYMGCKSFQMFFEKLTKMETKSLRQTRDVLQQREVIEITMENLLPKLDAGLSKVEEMRIEIKMLEDFKTQIEDNSDFTYTVSETVQTKLDLETGTHVTNCLICNYTCHKDCKIPKDEDKKKCSAMDTNGNCTQCNGKCVWDLHHNNPYIFEYVTVQKQKTYTEKLEKYRRAEGETMTRQKVVERMTDDLFVLEDEIMDLMGKINRCNNILRRIALRPDPLSVVEHIDLLIESEKFQKRPGFKDRILSLKQCRKKATVGDDVNRFRTSLTDTKHRKNANMGDGAECLRTCQTDTKKTITVQVKLQQKEEKSKRRETLNFFKPVMNYFKK